MLTFYRMSLASCYLDPARLFTIAFDRHTDRVVDRAEFAEPFCPFDDGYRVGVFEYLIQPDRVGGICGGVEPPEIDVIYIVPLSLVKVYECKAWAGYIVNIKFEGIQNALGEEGLPCSETTG